MDMDKIADMLLAGNISSKKAVKLAKNSRKINKKTKKTIDGKFNLTQKEGELRVSDLDNNTVGHLTYSLGTDSSGNTFATLDDTQTSIRGSGLFSKMYNAFIDLVSSKGAQYVDLDVDADNSKAIDVYEHLGFSKKNNYGLDDTYNQEYRKNL